MSVPSVNLPDSSRVRAYPGSTVTAFITAFFIFLYHIITKYIAFIFILMYLCSEHSWNSRRAGSIYIFKHSIWTPSDCPACLAHILNMCQMRMCRMREWRGSNYRMLLERWRGPPLSHNATCVGNAGWMAYFFCAVTHYQSLCEPLDPPS